MRYQFDLNSEISYNIAGDKFATYEVLKSRGISLEEEFELDADDYVISYSDGRIEEEEN